MGQEIAAEQRVVLGLDRAPLPRALDPLGAAPADAVQAEPATAGLEPLLERAALPRVGVRARDIRDQEATHREPLLEIRELVGDRGRDLALGQEAEEPQAGIVVVVPGLRSRRKAAGDEMRAC